jgi:hypothetical protein
MAFGQADLPLHGGKCPPWLFGRMVRLGGKIAEAIVNEFGTKDFLLRLSNPFFFQSLSCVLGFDWHSSGTTTTTMGALKEALHNEELGIKIAGGKGTVARETPAEVQKYAAAIGVHSKKAEKIALASRASAKVDSAALQDSFQLYHHTIVFDKNGNWTVVQQGMNAERGYARRYHWNSSHLQDFLEEPHKAICCDSKEKMVLNLTARESRENKRAAIDLARGPTKKIRAAFASLATQKQRNLFNWNKQAKISLFMPRSVNWKALSAAYDSQPKNYEELLMLPGIGPSTVRALALVSELIYGGRADWRDPVKYSFAHGGKDGVPFPVDRRTMDETTQIIGQAVAEAKIGNKEKTAALKRLNGLA